MSDAELARLALDARNLSYSPYSRYAVGAAVLTKDGRVFSGANIENASYGLCVCAERTAVHAAVMAGAREFAAIAIATTNSPPAAPCGMCRQTLAEFARDLRILLTNDKGEIEATTLDALLPHGFRGEDLK